MACYPLPQEFYATGGMQRLRKRFVPETLKRTPSDEALDDGFKPPLFSPLSQASRSTPFSGAVRLHWEPELPPQRPRKMSKDSSTGSDSGATILDPQSPSRRKSTSMQREPSIPTAAESRAFNLREHDHFDLRASVMDCISKSMGLAQPASTAATSPAPSAPESPSLLAQDSRFYSTSFGSLSALAQGIDDSASASTMSGRAHQPSELDNEVEILFFPKDSTIVRNGQSKTGVYYVIDGFLEVIMPPDSRNKEPTPLFSVKPGGIAGYLASLTGSHSYVVSRYVFCCYFAEACSYNIYRRTLMPRQMFMLATCRHKPLSE